MNPIRIIEPSQNPKFGLLLTEMANLYGFQEHYQFLNFLIRYYRDCLEELHKERFPFYPVFPYYIPMPQHLMAPNGPGLIPLTHYTLKWQRIIEIYMGKPIFNSVFSRKLANWYGYADFQNFRYELLDEPTIKQKLENRGWNAWKRKIISPWLWIIFEQLGMPRQAEELVKKEWWNDYITITGQTAPKETPPAAPLTPLIPMSNTDQKKNTTTLNHQSQSHPTQKNSTNYSV